MRTWCILAGLLLTALPVAEAGTRDEPELADPAGDATLGPSPARVPWGEDSDLLAAWLTDDAEGLHVHLRVADLDGVVGVASTGLEDAIFLFSFRTDHAQPQGAAARDGVWGLRADFQPANDPDWRFFLERPCRDGVDADGCDAADRDHIEGIQGSHDLAADTVAFTIPWDLLEQPRAGDGITAMWASTHFVYPAWPAYASDWEDDQRSVRYAYRFLDPPAEAALPQPEAGTEAKAAPEAAPEAGQGGTATTTSAAPRAPGAPAKPEAPAPAAPAPLPAVQESSAPVLAALGALVLAALVRRR